MFNTCSRGSTHQSLNDIGGGYSLGGAGLPHTTLWPSQPTVSTSHLRACDRTTSKMRGLSLKIIWGDSRWSENAQTHTYKHTVPYMKFKLNLLQIKCHVLEFTQDKAQKLLQRIIRVFAEALVSHDKHTLFALEESGPPRTTYTWVPVGNPALIGLDLPLTTLISIAKRRRKILTCIQINKNNKSKSLSDYAQQDLSVVARRSRILDMQGLKWINGLSLLAPTTNHF
jgi:hypothetical protein